MKRAANAVMGSEFNLVPDFMRLYFDLAEFRNRLHREILDKTYPILSQSQQKDIEASSRYEVTMTSDAFADQEDAFAIWDNQANNYYIAWDGTTGRVKTFPTKEQAQAFLEHLNRVCSTT